MFPIKWREMQSPAVTLERFQDSLTKAISSLRTAIVATDSQNRRDAELATMKALVDMQKYINKDERPERKELSSGNCYVSVATSNSHSECRARLGKPFSELPLEEQFELFRSAVNSVVDLWAAESTHLIDEQAAEHSPETWDAAERARRASKIG